MEQIEDSTSPPVAPLRRGGEITRVVGTLEVVVGLLKKLEEVVEGSHSHPLVGEISTRVTGAIAKLKAAGMEEAEEEEENFGPMAVTSPARLIVGKRDHSTFKKKTKNGTLRTGENKLVCRRWHPYHIITETSSTLEDGYAWRKYGQKVIMGAKHQRSYYRCTHKYSRGCQAIRQAQRSEDDDTTYHLTYMGQHTCGEAPSNHQLAGGCRGPERSRLISFRPPVPADIVPKDAPGGTAPPGTRALQSPPPTFDLSVERERFRSSEQDALSGLTQECLPLKLQPKSLRAMADVLPPIVPEIAPELGDGVTSGFVSTGAPIDESFDIAEMLALDPTDMVLCL